jgi:hypothetical protein
MVFGYFKKIEMKNAVIRNLDLCPLSGAKQTFFG